MSDKPLKIVGPQQIRSVLSCVDYGNDRLEFWVRSTLAIESQASVTSYPDAQHAQQILAAQTMHSLYGDLIQRIRELPYGTGFSTADMQLAAIRQRIHELADSLAGAAAVSTGTLQQLEIAKAR